MNYKKSLFKLSSLVFILVATFFFVSSALAASTCTCDDKSIVMDDCSTCMSYCGLKFKSCTINSATPGDGNLTNPQAGDASQVVNQELPNPLGITDVNALIARIINFVLSLVGSVSLLLFVYGGIIWMTSAGSPEKVKKGRDIVIWAVIGLAVVFASYILVKFVIQGISGV